MNFSNLMKAFDAVMALRDITKRPKGDAPSPEPTSLAQSTAISGLAGQIESRLTNVLVAALKEAFDRDHARLELERAQLDDQRRRADEALRMELRRQALDRELARLRLIGGAALIGWIASVIVAVLRLNELTPVARGLSAAAWLLLLGSLGAAFTAQGRLAQAATEPTPP